MFILLNGGLITNMLMINWKLVIVFLALLGLSFQARKFCSVLCRQTGCNGDTQNDCNNQCMANWIPSGTTCIPNTNANNNLLDTTQDIGGNVRAVVGGLTQSWTNSLCGSFNLYGWYNTHTVRITQLGGINVPFYSLSVHVGILSTDCSGGGDGNYWSSNTKYYLQFWNSTQTVATTSYNLNGGTRAQRQKFCFRDTRRQTWNRISQTYTYQTQGTNMYWDINNDQPNTTALWGFREFVITYLACNWKCIACFGGSNTQCTACLVNATYTMWLSGTTCNQTCITGYGAMALPNICVQCDPYCSVCFQTSTNCSACTTSGIYQAFYYSGNTSCVTACPLGFYANKTTHTCEICNSPCAQCVFNADYCTLCVTPFYYYNHLCYSPCLDGFFHNTNGINCTICSPFCAICIDPFDLCTTCTVANPYTAYLYNATGISGSCGRICPAGYYAEGYGGVGPNLCLICEVGCDICTGFPTPCSICTPGYYLYVSSCVTPCPNQTFQSNLTGTGLCLDCATYCVQLSIQMYFPTITHNQLYIDMSFSQALNFTTFNIQTFQTITLDDANTGITMDMFTITYKIIGESLYRISIEPKGYIFLYNITFTVTTRVHNGVTDLSESFYPFKITNYQMSVSKGWFLIKGPPFSDLETNVMESVSALSTKTNDLLDKPYIQELKKSGVFNLLFSGAQATSLSVLSNQIQSQNMYEGVKLWAVFVFFDVPPYEQISNQTKRFVTPTVEDQIRNAMELPGEERKLFSTDTMYWRFQRTGQTSFFIYDCYVPIFLIITCWILLIIAYKCKSRRWYPRHAPKLFSVTHKVHQMSLLYITMASIIEFIYFQPSSTQRIISGAVCIFFNIYFVIYELYIYYDMLKYPMAEIGNRLYDFYAMRYGIFLKNVRYQEYDINEAWSPKHWFRPYNFHFLSYYKKFLMIITLPLFYETPYAQMSALLAIQVLELIRIWVVWPFLSAGRNWLRFSLQIALTLFFMINLIQAKLINIIQSGDINEMESVIKHFYSLGWAGFIFVFYFNLMYIITGVYDLCVGLRISNRDKMDNARKQYYFGKIKDYQKDNQEASKDIVNRWVRLGNINNGYYGQLPQINVRIQEYTLRMMLGKFQIIVRKMEGLRMMKPKSHRKRNNTVTNKKIQKKKNISNQSHPQLYQILYSVYKKYSSNHIETVILKTFINVFQQDFDEGQQIPLDRNYMFQKLELISFDNEKQEKQLQEMLEEFPLSVHLFDSF